MITKLIIASSIFLTGCCAGIDTIKCDPMPKHIGYVLVKKK